jgi:phage baseplate assembly protein W
MAVERGLVFGTDLRVLERAGARDLIGDNAGDLALARGNENIEQALALRLLVRKGELARLGFPDYGSRLHELIGAPNNQRTHVILMGHARAAIEQDPRVREVVSVRTQVPPGDRGAVRIDMEIALIETNTPLNLVFDVRLGTA